MRYVGRHPGSLLLLAFISYSLFLPFSLARLDDALTSLTVEGRGARMRSHGIEAVPAEMKGILSRSAMCLVTTKGDMSRYEIHQSIARKALLAETFTVAIYRGAPPMTCVCAAAR